MGKHVESCKGIFGKIVSREEGLLSLGLDMTVRLRGVVSIKHTDPDKAPYFGKDTYEIIQDILDGRELEVNMYRKSNNALAPFLVDIMVLEAGEDGEALFLNEWLVENGYANKYNKKPRGGRQ